MRKTILSIVLIAFLITPMTVHADIAPPARPPGANPEPGSADTQVRMVAESVEIKIMPEGGRDDLKGSAYFTADFTMRNLGDQEERMAARFPLGSGDGWGNIPEIKDMRVSVDGTDVGLRRIMGEDPTRMADEVPWVEFDVVFPPQKDVKVLVRYSLEAAGELPYIWFNYIFSTGAAWKGTIGSASLTVRFPYPVSELNYIPGNPGSTFPKTTPAGQVDGNDITWTWQDFEPEEGDNFQITLVTPPVWFDVLKERDRVKQAPGDGEAWGRLGKLYKQILMSPHGGRGFRDDTLRDDPGAQEIYRQSVDAYQKSLALLPDDALWHAGYADLLGWYSAYAGWEGYDTLPQKLEALKEIKVAIDLAPGNEQVQQIADMLSFYMDEGMVWNGNTYDFPWLTATPVATATEIIPVEPSPTLEVPATETPMVQVTPESPTTAAESEMPVETAVPEKPKPSLPICGSVLLLPAALILMVSRKFWLS